MSRVMDEPQIFGEGDSLDRAEVEIQSAESDVAKGEDDKMSIFMSGTEESEIVASPFDEARRVGLAQRLRSCRPHWVEE